MLERETRIAALLIDIEAHLRQLNLWESEPPPPEALASTEPFAVDTLTLPQWLQFIFLPTMRQLLQAELPLPGQCGIEPMAEEYFRGTAMPVAELLVELRRIDEVLSGGA